MKTIGLIGGMSWESTVTYYRLINEHVAGRLGGLHSARCLLWSFDFDEIQTLQRLGQWDAATDRMIAAGNALKAGGADFLVICTNTMHKMADAVETATGLPLLHIADATGTRIRDTGHGHVGLLGTRFTMEDDFYCGRLVERHGLKVSVPPESDRQLVHDVIFGELCRSVVTDESRAAFRRIIQDLADAGCEGVILGCTEIGMLIGQNHTPVPLYDTTLIHAEAAVGMALG